VSDKDDVTYKKGDFVMLRPISTGSTKAVKAEVLILYENGTVIHAYDYENHCYRTVPKENIEGFVGEKAAAAVQRAKEKALKFSPKKKEPK
jgi:hypothetical protein